MSPELRSNKIGIAVKYGQILQPVTKMLRMPEVVDRSGYSKPSIYRLVKIGKFPAPVKLGERATAWPEHVIQDWLDSRKPAA